LAFGRKKTPTPNAEKTGAHALAAAGAEVQNYQSAVQLMQQGKFEKALAAFGKLLPVAPEVLQERCRMYISACKRQIEQNQRHFATPEEQCDYATSLVNSGYYEDAREQFFAILDAHPDADYAFYGLAVLEGVTGNIEACMDNLNRAIELNPKARLQARSDTDFQGVVDDPRFTELLYPEIS
jgi:tetratricopeptide (TPR) repeat protein